MNKKIKILSTLVCGAALSSTVALTSVQAKTTQDIKSTQITTNSTQYTSTAFNYFATLSEDSLQKVINFYQASSSNQSESAIYNFLINSKITDSSVASTISHSLTYFLGNNKIKAQDYYGTGVSFLKITETNNAYYMTIIPNNQLNYSFKLYTKIYANDGDQISSYIKNNPNLTPSQLASYMVSNGMIASAYANTVATLLITAGHGDYTASGRINSINWNYNSGCGIQVLQSTTNPNAFVLAPEPL